MEIFVFGVDIIFYIANENFFAIFFQKTKLYPQDSSMNFAAQKKVRKQLEKFDLSFNEIEFLIACKIIKMLFKILL